MIPLSVKGAWLEFIGTFILCTYGGYCVNAEEVNPMGGLISAFGHGAIVAVIMFIAVEASGAQFNPAVALALFALNKQTWKTTLIYIIF